MRALLALLNRFRRDRSGNIAVIFTLSLLPILSAVGCAVDYSMANQLRTKLQAAADAASVGSLAKTAPGFLAAGSMTRDGSVPAGVTDATKLFNANMNGVTGYTLNYVTPTVAKSGARSPPWCSSPPAFRRRFSA
jgi:Flp pilus assembly protein TadG